MLQTPVIPSGAVVRETDGYGVEGPCVPLEPAMRREYRFYVYIMQSASRRALYIGMTNNLHKRVWQDKNHSFEGFTDDYNATRLVYWESSDDVRKAIGREKQLKGWRREKKMRLVETTNPRWQDLAAGWYETQGPSTAAPVHFVSERPRSG
jgi:putative endonuclease